MELVSHSFWAILNCWTTKKPTVSVACDSAGVAYPEKVYMYWFFILYFLELSFIMLVIHLYTMKLKVLKVTDFSDSFDPHGYSLNSQAENWVVAVPFSRILLAQGNPSFQCSDLFTQLRPQGSPRILLEWVGHPILQRSSQPESSFCFLDPFPYGLWQHFML